ncbi:MAG TPA: M28 family peptidase [Acidobacteria bacterium]|nr:M28 family peptidase [Acidobacteriota bacterium]
MLSLAVGIGANTAIFSRPDELVNIYAATPTTRYSTLSYPDFEELRDGTADVFSGIGVAVFTMARVEHEDGVGVVVSEAVSGDYFPLLGISALAGLTGHNVVGVVPEPSDENILVNAHADGWFDAAGDNADGLAALLAMARHFARPEHQLDRTLVFVASGGHHSRGLNGPIISFR